MLKSQWTAQGALGLPDNRHGMPGEGHARQLAVAGAVKVHEKHHTWRGLMNSKCSQQINEIVLSGASS